MSKTNKSTKNVKTRLAEDPARKKQRLAKFQTDFLLEFRSANNWPTIINMTQYIHKPPV